MSFLTQTLPVALAVMAALSLAFVFTRSLLHLMFGVLGRSTARAANTPAE